MNDDPTDRLSSVFTLTKAERAQIRSLSVADLLDAADRLAASQESLGRMLREMIEEGGSTWP